MGGACFFSFFSYTFPIQMIAGMGQSPVVAVKQGPVSVVHSPIQYVLEEK